MEGGRQEGDGGGGDGIGREVGMGSMSRCEGFVASCVGPSSGLYEGGLSLFMALEYGLLPTCAVFGMFCSVRICLARFQVPCHLRLVHGNYNTIWKVALNPRGTGNWSLDLSKQEGPVGWAEGYQMYCMELQGCFQFNEIAE
ncbi:hypothetical protein KC19_1G079100 [Ceratodon purpureus]|uniref:Uncharacterized protein n=1 Tax=Ceratodon purpureus TaxID=3225 RepID=A0A8T0J4W2_CERPU|nr:hypothetical protein KC19_1G079100 [Ceratodon purpureus]